MEDNRITIHEAYKICSDGIMHYSKLIWEVRLVIIAQGLVILGGYLMTLEKMPDDNLVHGIICVLGILFSIILSGLQNNYINDYLTHLNQGARIEGKYFSKINTGIIDENEKILPLTSPQKTEPF